MRRAPVVLAPLALVLSAASCLLAVVLFSLVADESRERRDQNCLTFERDHQSEVDRLATTYGYLATLPAADRGTSINRAVVAGLPALREKVRALRPPRYCNAAGVGLPEPGPSIPKRPKGL